jgi:hypothetical protein
VTTQVTFNFQIGAATGARTPDGNSSNDVTITAVIDDGAIDVNDVVTVSGMTASVSTLSGISNGGMATYLGTGEFSGVTGFVFTVDGNLTETDRILVLTQDTVDIGVVLAVEAFSGDTTWLTLGAGAACFAEGTLIATPSGDDVAVEHLAIGDPVLSASGETVSVKWIGKRRVSTRLGSERNVMPVRVRAGALGHGVPINDLVLTSDHALMIDGLLINAGALVNHTTIDYVPRAEMPEGYTVYHLETEKHEVILAEGAAAETFVDHVGRKAFDNYAEYLDIYGAERTIPELPHPRICSARLLPAALKTRLGIGSAAKRGLSDVA